MTVIKNRFDESVERIFELEKQIVQETDSEKKKQLVSQLVEQTEDKTKIVENVKTGKWFKIIFSIAICIMFFGLNFFVLFIVYQGFQIDLTHVDTLQYKRFATEKILIALITGILLETALAFGLLARYVFSSDNKNFIKTLK